jgi:hypothetical protein
VASVRKGDGNRSGDARGGQRLAAQIAQIDAQSAVCVRHGFDMELACHADRAAMVRRVVVHHGGRTWRRALGFRLGLAPEGRDEDEQRGQLHARA